MSGVREQAEALSPEVAALSAGCDVLLYPPDLAEAIAAVEKAAAVSEAVAGRLTESLARGERALERFPTPDRAAVDVPDDLDGAAITIATACATEIGGRVPPWLLQSRPVRVATIWDDREEPSRVPFGLLFREALKARGWNVLPQGPAEAEAPTLVLVASTPQAAYPVVFGHPRLLADLGAPGLCAWATEPAMEPAAAWRLDDLARGAAS
jgi:hypothetical protein